MMLTDEIKFKLTEIKKLKNKPCVEHIEEHNGKLGPHYVKIHFKYHMNMRLIYNDDLRITSKGVTQINFQGIPGDWYTLRYEWDVYCSDDIMFKDLDKMEVIIEPEHLRC